MRWLSDWLYENPAWEALAWTLGLMFFVAVPIMFLAGACGRG